MTDSDPDFICFAAQDWWYHNRAHSDFQLMLRVAKSRKVLLINSIGMRMPTPGKSSKVLQKILRKLRSVLKLLRRPDPELPNLYVLSPLMLPAYGTPWLRSFAFWLVRVQVRLAAGWIGIRKPAIMITLPTAWEVVKPMTRSSLIYNRSDKHSQFKEADTSYIEHLEQELMQNADHVLYVSRVLMEEERAQCAKPPYFLDHGVDMQRFAAQKLDEPEDLRSIPHPRIGFFGGLRKHLVDFPLLQKLARELPDVQLVLVGDAPSDIDELLDFPNVHWLGFKSHAQIPAYGAGFDVGLMPYLTSEWIRNCNPIKLKEYLALGLRVVSTDFPEARNYTGSIQVAEDADDYVRQVKALASAPWGPEERAQRSAKLTQSLAAFTWEAKAGEVTSLAARL